MTKMSQNKKFNRHSLSVDHTKHRPLSTIKQISQHKIDTHFLYRSHTEAQVPQQNQSDFAAQNRLTSCRDRTPQQVPQEKQTDFATRNRHSLAVEIAHRSTSPSAKSNRFRGTKSTLTNYRDRTLKHRSLSKIK